LAPERPAQAEKTTTTTTTVSDKSGSELDAVTVIRAAQAISSEILLDKLLEELMRSAITNAGATRGVLLLEREGALTIEAIMTVDPHRLEVGIGLPASESRELAQSIVQLV